MSSVIQINASALDGYAYFMSSEDEHLSLDKYIDRICKLEPTTENMVVGTAFHEGLQIHGPELFAEHPPVSMQIDDMHFRFYDEIQHDVEYMRPTAHEIRYERHDVPVYGSESRKAKIVGVIDGLRHNRITEIKTTKTISLERYIDSWQWKIYLLLQPFAEDVEYQVFQVSIKESQHKCFDVVVRDFRSVVCTRYPDLESDVLQKASEYAGLLHELELSNRIVGDGRRWQKVKKEIENKE